MTCYIVWKNDKPIGIYKTHKAAKRKICDCLKKNGIDICENDVYCLNSYMIGADVCMHYDEYDLE